MTTYNFYGHLIVRLLTKHRGYQSYFDNEYARISQEAVETDVPTIDVEIVRSLPEVEPDDLVREIRFKRLFTFRFLLRDVDSEHVKVYFQRHWVDRVYMNAIGVFLQAQVLEPLMYLKLLESGILFLHAGGVSKGQTGLLLPAEGGTGKTTLSMALLGAGHQLLGDDLLLVDVAGGIVHPYPRPLHIFTYNVRNLRGAHIPFRYQFRVYAKNALRFVLERVLRTEFLISTRVHADELFDHAVFGTTVPYTAVAFLRKQGPAIEVVRVTDENVDAIADQIAASADLNESLEVLLEERPDATARWQALEHSTIADLLRRRGQLAFVNTRALDLDDLEEFADAISGRAG